MGDLKIPPKITPMQPSITAVEMEIQKGPSVDLLYRCLISVHAKKNANPKHLNPLMISLRPELLTLLTLVEGSSST